MSFPCPGNLSDLPRITIKCCGIQHHVNVNRLFDHSGMIRAKAIDTISYIPCLRVAPLKLPETTCVSPKRSGFTGRHGLLCHPLALNRAIPHCLSLLLANEMSVFDYVTLR